MKIIVTSVKPLALEIVFEPGDQQIPYFIHALSTAMPIFSDVLEDRLEAAKEHEHTAFKGNKTLEERLALKAERLAAARAEKLDEEKSLFLADRDANQLGTIVAVEEEEKETITGDEDEENLQATVATQGLNPGNENKEAKPSAAMETTLASETKIENKPFLDENSLLKFIQKSKDPADNDEKINELIATGLRNEALLAEIIVKSYHEGAVKKIADDYQAYLRLKEHIIIQYYKLEKGIADVHDWLKKTKSTALGWKAKHPKFDRHITQLLGEIESYRDKDTERLAKIFIQYYVLYDAVPTDVLADVLYDAVPTDAPDEDHEVLEDDLKWLDEEFFASFDDKIQEISREMRNSAPEEDKVEHTHTPIETKQITTLITVYENYRTKELPTKDLNVIRTYQRLQFLTPSRTDTIDYIELGKINDEIKLLIVQYRGALKETSVNIVQTFVQLIIKNQDVFIELYKQKYSSHNQSDTLIFKMHCSFKDVRVQYKQNPTPELTAKLIIIYCELTRTISSVINSSLSTKREGLKSGNDQLRHPDWKPNLNITQINQRTSRLRENIRYLEQEIVQLEADLAILDKKAMDEEILTVASQLCPVTQFDWYEEAALFRRTQTVLEAKEALIQKKRDYWGKIILDKMRQDFSYPSSVSQGYNDLADVIDTSEIEFSEQYPQGRVRLWEKAIPVFSVKVSEQMVEVDARGILEDARRKIDTDKIKPSTIRIIDFLNMYFATKVFGSHRTADFIESSFNLIKSSLTGDEKISVNDSLQRLSNVSENLIVSEQCIQELKERWISEKTARQNMRKQAVLVEETLSVIETLDKESIEDKRELDALERNYKGALYSFRGEFPADPADEETPTVISIQSNDPKSKFQRFLAAGKVSDEILSSADFFKNALFLVAVYGDVAMAETLIASGKFDLNAQDGKGNTVLHYAALGGHLKFIKHFLPRIVNKQIKNQQGKTPYELAVEIQKIYRSDKPYDFNLQEIINQFEYTEIFAEDIELMRLFDQKDIVIIPATELNAAIDRYPTDQFEYTAVYHPEGEKLFIQKRTNITSANALDRMDVPYRYDVIKGMLAPPLVVDFQEMVPADRKKQTSSPSFLFRKETALTIQADIQSEALTVSALEATSQTVVAGIQASLLGTAQEKPMQIVYQQSRDFLANKMADKNDRPKWVPENEEEQIARREKSSHDYEINADRPVLLQVKMAIDAHDTYWLYRVLVTKFIEFKDIMALAGLRLSDADVKKMTCLTIPGRVIAKGLSINEADSLDPLKESDIKQLMEMENLPAPRIIELLPKLTLVVQEILSDLSVDVVEKLSDLITAGHLPELQTILASDEADSVRERKIAALLTPPQTQMLEELEAKPDAKEKLEEERNSKPEKEDDVEPEEDQETISTDEPIDPIQRYFNEMRAREILENGGEEVNESEEPEQFNPSVETKNIAAKLAILTKEDIATIANVALDLKELKRLSDLPFSRALSKLDQTGRVTLMTLLSPDQEEDVDLTYDVGDCEEKQEVKDENSLEELPTKLAGLITHGIAVNGWNFIMYASSVGSHDCIPMLLNHIINNFRGYILPNFSDPEDEDEIYERHDKFIDDRLGFEPMVRRNKKTGKVLEKDEKDLLIQYQLGIEAVVQKMLVKKDDEGRNCIMIAAEELHQDLTQYRYIDTVVYLKNLFLVRGIEQEIYTSNDSGKSITDIINEKMEKQISISGYHSYRIGRNYLRDLQVTLPEYVAQERKQRKKDFKEHTWKTLQSEALAKKTQDGNYHLTDDFKFDDNSVNRKKWFTPTINVLNNTTEELSALDAAVSMFQIFYRELDQKGKQQLRENIQKHFEAENIFVLFMLSQEDSLNKILQFKKVPGDSKEFNEVQFPIPDEWLEDLHRKYQRMTKLIKPMLKEHGFAVMGKGQLFVKVNQIELMEHSSARFIRTEEFLRACRNNETDAELKLLTYIMVVMQVMQKIILKFEQIICCLAFVFYQDKFERLFLQIKPREGKSEIFAIVGTFFALRGLDVDVCTYSRHHADISYEKFKSFFSYFGVPVYRINKVNNKKSFIEAYVREPLIEQMREDPFYKMYLEYKQSNNIKPIVYGSPEHHKFYILGETVYGRLFNQNIRKEYQVLLNDESDHVVYDDVSDARMTLAAKEDVSEERREICCAVLSYFNQSWQNPSVGNLQNYVNQHLKNKNIDRQVNRREIIGLFHQGEFNSSNIILGRDFYITRDGKAMIVAWDINGEKKFGQVWLNDLQNLVETQHGLRLTASMGVIASISNISYLKKYKNKVRCASGTGGNKKHRDWLNNELRIVTYDVPRWRQDFMPEKKPVYVLKTELEQMQRLVDIVKRFYRHSGVIVNCESMEECLKVFRILKRMLPSKYSIGLFNDRDIVHPQAEDICDAVSDEQREIARLFNCCPGEKYDAIIMTLIGIRSMTFLKNKFQITGIVTLFPFQNKRTEEQVFSRYLHQFQLFEIYYRDQFLEFFKRRRLHQADMITWSGTELYQHYQSISDDSYLDFDLRSVTIKIKDLRMPALELLGRITQSRDFDEFLMRAWIEVFSKIEQACNSVGQIIMDNGQDEKAIDDSFAEYQEAGYVHTDDPVEFVGKQVTDLLVEFWNSQQFAQQFAMEGNNLLHYAVLCCLHPLIKLLAHHRPDLKQQKNQNNETPLDIANQLGNSKELPIQLLTEPEVVDPEKIQKLKKYGFFALKMDVTLSSKPVEIPPASKQVETSHASEELEISSALGRLEISPAPGELESSHIRPEPAVENRQCVFHV